MNHSIEKASLIEQIRLKEPFAHLSAEHLALLLNSVQLEDAMPGDVLITQGESNRDYLLLLAGELEVTRKLSCGGGEQGIYLGLAKAGEGVGEMSLLSSLPRTASVRATKPSKIISMVSRICRPSRRNRR
jgi:CRP-like cAMP-binding protein